MARIALFSLGTPFLVYFGFAAHRQAIKWMARKRKVDGLFLQNPRLAF